MNSLHVLPQKSLLNLDILQPENIKDTLHAYQIAKRCNEKRVMAESVKWGAERRPDQLDLSGNYCDALWQSMNLTDRAVISIKTCSRKCPAGRPGTADEVANVAELLMSDKGAFITGSDFLIDGGATASYFYGPLKPEE